MAPPAFFLRRFLLAALWGGVVAGVVSTLVQILLWLAFTDAFPGILWRDARLTAALVLEAGVLAQDADARVMLVATVIHFALSVLYAATMWALARRVARGFQMAVGALLGAALYVVNLHGFVLLFPWFADAGGWITFVAHVAFGVSVVVTCRRIDRA